MLNIEQARKILGVSKSASEEEVKKKYKALAKKWHPDVNESKEAYDKIKEINNAYEAVMKEQFGKIDVWEDYDIWWWRQYKNDPIWGNLGKDEDSKPLIGRKKGTKNANRNK